jgi:hypothetical protein
MIFKSAALCRATDGFARSLLALRPTFPFLVLGALFASLANILKGHPISLYVIPPTASLL